MEAASTVVQQNRAESQPKATRRRLAPNVVCMYPEDRPRIVGPRWYGRHPRAVTSLRRWQQLAEGDIAVFVEGKNIGKRVRVLGCVKDAPWTHGQPFDVESMGGLLWLAGKDGGPLKQGTAAVCGKNWLRKISSWSRK